MSFMKTVVFATCLSVSGLAANASAAWCFPIPFSGVWGAGYAPFYGGYYGSGYYYGFAPVSYAVSYRAGYCGCSLSCGSCCDSSCVEGSGTDCDGSNRTDNVPSPTRDPGFRDGSDDEDRGKKEPDWGKQDYNSDRTIERDRMDGIRSDETKPEFLRRGNGDPADAGSLNGFDLEDQPTSPDDDFGGDSGYGRRSPFEAPVDDFELESIEGSREDAIDVDARKPQHNEPSDDTGATDEGEASSSNPTEDADDDLVAPPADTGFRTKPNLLHGVLSDGQARVKHNQSDSDSRLAVRIRGNRRLQSVHWSGRQSERQRPLNWIGAPQRDGRIRL
ncbi:MAG: hypothetical protein MK102_08715 [Fuerstiella sp.]|nr:hypothetical protein [Fuerstiella sp.]